MSLQLKSFLVHSDHKYLAALNFAASIKKSMPIAKKKDNLGAKSSTNNPLLFAALMYSRPSAIVKANS